MIVKGLAGKGVAGGLAAVIALLLCSGSAFAGTLLSPLDSHQWKVASFDPEANRNNADYSFKSLEFGGSKTYLIDHHRTFGADVDFGNGEKVSTGLRQFSFRRASGVAGPISPTEDVAVFDNFTHMYLVNAHQRFGIDLQWVKSPSYQWRISIVQGYRMSLFNNHRGDFLVYGKETFGVNLVWLKELTHTLGHELPESRSATLDLIAHPLVEGFVPYYESFPFVGGQTGPNKNMQHLETISNPFPLTPIYFLKRGQTTATCPDTGALVDVGPGATMTQTQNQEVFGSAFPPLPIKPVVCAPASFKLRIVPLNIVYDGTAEDFLG